MLSGEVLSAWCFVGAASSATVCKCCTLDLLHVGCLGGRHAAKQDAAASHLAAFSMPWAGNPGGRAADSAAHHCSCSNAGGVRVLLQQASRYPVQRHCACSLCLWLGRCCRSGVAILMPGAEGMPFACLRVPAAACWLRLQMHSFGEPVRVVDSRLHAAHFPGSPHFGTGALVLPGPWCKECWHPGPRTCFRWIAGCTYYAGSWPCGPLLLPLRLLLPLPPVMA